MHEYPRMSRKMSEDDVIFNYFVGKHIFQEQTEMFRRVPAAWLSISPRLSPVYCRHAMPDVICIDTILDHKRLTLFRPAEFRYAYPLEIAKCIDPTNAYLKQDLHKKYRPRKCFNRQTEAIYELYIS